jgi:hypothetical protein
MAKTLCDWSKKDIEKQALKLLQIVTPQRFLCLKCARTANDRRYLCRGVDLEVLREDAEAEEKER